MDSCIPQLFTYVVIILTVFGGTRAKLCLVLGVFRRMNDAFPGKFSY